MIFKPFRRTYLVKGFLRRAISSFRDESKEFKVPVPWGHIAGTEWGPTNGKKMLAVHGWQDNAGSFSTLIPLLDPSLNVYAIDMPGHGRSSPMPDGHTGAIADKVSTIHRVIKHFGFENFIYMGHSMGGGIGYLYSATFPDRVSKFIAIDLLKPYAALIEQSLEFNKETIETLIEIDKKRSATPPSYSYDEAIKRLVEGNPSLTQESAIILAKRGLTQSADGGFYFSRDLKVKTKSIHYGVTPESLSFYAKKIRCPVLFIKADGFGSIPLSYYEKEIELLGNREAPFRLENIDGNHHVHLNNPALVSPPINEFISIL